MQGALHTILDAVGPTPIELLGKVLQAMNRAGLIDSVHGVHGGYRLTRSLREIAVGDVVQAIDGPLHLVPCTDGHSVCEQAEGCVIQSPMARVEEHLRRYFSRLTLEELFAEPTCCCQETVS